MLVGQGGVDHPCGKGGGGEEGGGNEDGGRDEKGEESPMDGLIGWTRLGKEGRLPQDACVILQLYSCSNWIYDIFACQTYFFIISQKMFLHQLKMFRLARPQNKSFI